jgi:hypothetical protein
MKLRYLWFARTAVVCAFAMTFVTGATLYKIGPEWNQVGMTEEHCLVTEGFPGDPSSRCVSRGRSPDMERTPTWERIRGALTG